MSGRGKKQQQYIFVSGYSGKRRSKHRQRLFSDTSQGIVQCFLTAGNSNFPREKCPEIRAPPDRV